MSEAVQLAKAAREQLAQALSALQSDDKVPAALIEVAEPIARAMTVLHRVERTNGENLEGRDGALVAVRNALEQIQKVNDAHPAVDMVMEAVAASLSKVHALVRYTPPAARPAPAPPTPVARPTPAPPAPPAPVEVAARPTPAPASPPPSQPIALVTPLSAPSRPAEIAPAPAPSPPRAPGPAVTLPSASVSQAGSGSSREPSQPSRPTAPGPFRAASATSSIDVELGTHSSSNFYKGLGGNDVIEHGGIFVATYKALKIGTPVNLRVLLPGDYEFQAAGVVQWTREGGGSTEPGFGARFTQISPEGRQLVYRYTRNREPMFYDDL